MTKYPRGSEWRIWDLHLHTPSAHLNQEFGADWDRYLNALAASPADVFGITNYFCFAKDELEKIKEGLLQRGKSKTVLGNLEFRIHQPNKDGEYINIHVLFSENLPSDKINAAFARLPLVNTTLNGKTVYCSQESIKDAGLGFDRILVDFKCLIDFLPKHFNPSEYLVACCPSGYGSLRPASAQGRGAGLAVEFDKNCQIAFGNENDRKFMLDTARYQGAKEKPVVAGSDAHKFEQLDTRWCWIKAHPTFDGLRQVVFEPSARISLQTDNPNTNYRKPYFSSLDISGKIIANELLEFQKASIPLNPGLVAIIGGRGTGKSILLDCLYRKFHNASPKNGERLTNILPESCTVTFTKQDGIESISYDTEAEGAISYLHVRQGDVRRIAERPDDLSDEIKKLLNLDDPESHDVLGLDMAAILSQIAEIKRWQLMADTEGSLINTKSSNEKIIKINQERINAITSNENKILVEQFNKNAAHAQQISTVLLKLTGLEVKLPQFAHSIENEINAVNAVSNTYSISIPPVNFTAQIQAIHQAREKLKREKDLLTQANDAIRQELKSKGIEQDPSGLLDKVSGFQKQISEANQRLIEIDAKEQNLASLHKRRIEIAGALITSLTNNVSTVNDAFSKLKAGRDGWDTKQTTLVQKLLCDVNISGEILFDEAEFYNGLLPVLDGRKFRATNETSQLDRIKSKIGVHSFDDFRRLINGEAVISDDNDNKISLDEFAQQQEFFLQSDKYTLYDYIFLPPLQKRYLRVRALIRYKGKNPNQLSVGQRGTFYVCMKLATDPFGSPFVFDQPEDDLDNDFIVRELVPLFREIKDGRQIIIATHNANLVVNADAEQIIRAVNEDEKLAYVSGGLEDVQIRSAVCTVLEGGEDAFMKRERKYGLERIESA